MATIATFGLVVLLLFIGAGLFAASIYNALVSLRNRYQNAFSQIDVQLKRRYDLIPNLVETAKGYMEHESETLERVIAARTGAMTAAKRAAADPTDASAMQGLMSAEGMLGAALGRLNVVSEQYPQLRADSTMNRLMEELTSTENKISFARQAFNDSATQYNIKAESFPSNIIAGMFQFKRATLLEFEGEDIQTAPKVSFS